MKKVAFISPTYPVLSETFIQTEVDSIKACGHEVCVLTFEIEDLKQQFDYSVIKIGKDIHTSMYKNLTFPGILKALKFVREQEHLPKKSLFNYGLKLALQLADIKAEHIHAHFCQHTAAHAIVAAKLLNITCSFVAHGHDVYETAYDIDKKIIASDFVVTVCKDMQRDFEHMASGNIKLLHCGVKTEQFVIQPKIPSTQLTFVFLGRLVEQKGIHHLIDALAPIAKQLNIQLDIIGTGEMEEQLKDQAIQQGLSNHVHFLGSKPHSWVKENLVNYDCLVAPFCFSETGCVDTGPLVLKEAMAVGTPVITTNIMGCKEIVTSETGYLVNEKNVAELQQSIKQFAQLTFNERTKMGKMARERVEDHFNAFKQAKQLSGWIESAAS
ncbi:glycosyltransferase family 4 protein [Aliivibrio sp. 1S128]|jgi:glycosyltransferase involved in cell wall biosynthesis|uniref:glycosyltransferase family 4 protein n=1 Tax=Aliivibrio sp. 1S128 TaxID=1840085 RepID=UPI00080E9AD0|nr:glycosyltransferase family 4 protein [Aliivibrio sp. 1S128]OCH19785.1 colanic acid biosynthesis glycosyltransferase WcaL [Aliivibrio sp. 1S128]